MYDSAPTQLSVCDISRVIATRRADKQARQQILHAPSMRPLLESITENVSAVGLNRLSPSYADGSSLRQTIWTICILGGLGFMCYLSHTYGMRVILSPRDNNQSMSIMHANHDANTQRVSYYLEKPTVMKTYRIDAGKEGIELPRIEILDWTMKVRDDEYENVSKAISCMRITKKAAEINQLNKEMQDELKRVNWTDYIDSATTSFSVVMNTLDSGEGVAIGKVTKTGNTAGRTTEGRNFNKATFVGGGLMLGIVRSGKENPYDSQPFAG